MKMKKTSALIFVLVGAAGQMLKQVLHDKIC